MKRKLFGIVILFSGALLFSCSDELADEINPSLEEQRYESNEGTQGGGPAGPPPGNKVS